MLVYFFAPSTLLHPNISMQILSCSLYISWGADKKNLLDNHELLWLVIISSILMTKMCDSGVIL